MKTELRKFSKKSVDSKPQFLYAFRKILVSTVD
jgi:hypothetical protein